MKTFKEILLECENYSRSKEYYELLKESYELTLMETFIESQTFQEENEMDLFSESYFIEKIDKDALKNLKVKVIEKAKVLGGKLEKAFEKVLFVFTSLMTKASKALGKFKSSVENKTVAKKLNKELDNDVISDLGDKFAFLFTDTNRSIVDNLSIKENISNPQFGDKIRLGLNILFTNNDIIYNKEGYNISDIEKIYTRIMAGKMTKNTLKKSEKIVIHNDNEKLEKVNVKLSSLTEEFKKSDIDKNIAPEIVADLNTFIADIIPVYNLIIKLYSNTPALMNIIKNI